ncbi:MAG: hypothetical protein ACOCRK_00705, partial [bacterium]
MNNSEAVKKPTGKIGIILHKGGEYNKESGKIEGGQIIKEEKMKNKIVDVASKLMAIRLYPIDVPGENPFGVQYGLQYLAVGVGICQNPNELWDSETNPVVQSNGDTAVWPLQNPPEATVDQQILEGELFRKRFTSACFIDSNGEDTNEPTKILKLVTTFDDNEAVGPITEMGLFGGDALDFGGNGEGRNTGYMFNYKTFAVWNKPEGARLTITWEL